MSKLLLSFMRLCLLGCQQSVKYADMIKIQNLHNSAIFGKEVLAETPISHQNKITIYKAVSYPLADELRLAEFFETFLV